MEHHKPKLFYIKIEKSHMHQGVRKLATRIITTHDPRIMPKYFKDRAWSFSAAKRSA